MRSSSGFQRRHLEPAVGVWGGGEGGYKNKTDANWISAILLKQMTC